MFELELESEVVQWLDGLTPNQFEWVSRYLDRLAADGLSLRGTITRQLSGKLRELRFQVDGRQMRVTYYMVDGRITALTVFAKTQQHEARQIERARRAMERCMLERHVAEEDE